jgi:glucose-1-phosphate adenylyltransferase
MGIYIFSWSALKKYLAEDDADTNSTNDFGKDVIPKMLREGCSMVAYRFDGYWKDVGTIESLWQANMDLLDDLHLGFTDWHILSRTAGRPPHVITATGSIKNTLITEGCEISGYVENSILSVGVIVEEGAVVKDSILMENAKICKNAVVNYAILDEDSIVGENAVVGEPLGDGANLTVIAPDSIKEESTTGGEE